MDEDRGRFQAEPSLNPAWPTTNGHQLAEHRTIGQKAALTWIEYNPSKSSSAGRRVSTSARSHAAFASAAARKATIARKREQQIKGNDAVTAVAHRPRRQAGAMTRLNAGKVGRMDLSRRRGSDGTPPSDSLAAHVSSLLGGLWSTVDRPDMALKTFRTSLLAAFTNNTTLFQCAIFVAATHSNTCGLPPHAVHGMGPGLILLQGATLNAIQSVVVSGGEDTMTSVAIAVLAGWERRFGDRDSYNVHIEAWKKLALPPSALDTNNTTALAELALESFREALNDRGFSSATPSTSSSSDGRLSHFSNNLLPLGFSVFNCERPESLSLLNNAAFSANLDPSRADALQSLRKTCLENMAWGPAHTLGCEPQPAHEAVWDQAELNALYHVRAAMISINGVLLVATSEAHKVRWDMDISAGLDVHEESCHHLRTNDLMGTKYQDVALWARFSICAISRARSTGGAVRTFLCRAGLDTWTEMKRLMEGFVYPELYCGTKYYDLYRGLMGGSVRSHNL